MFEPIKFFRYLRTTCHRTLRDYTTLNLFSLGELEERSLKVPVISSVFSYLIGIQAIVMKLCDLCDKTLLWQPCFKGNLFLNLHLCL